MEHLPRRLSAWLKRRLVGRWRQAMRVRGYLHGAGVVADGDAAADELGTDDVQVLLPYHEVEGKRSANPSLIFPDNAANLMPPQATKRARQKWVENKYSAGGGIPGLRAKEQGMGTGQRRARAGAGELVRPLAALAAGTP